MAKTRKVEFDGALGETLAARLDYPDGETPRGYALFAHCFSCSKNIKAASVIARRLAARGIAVLRFDFTGLGQSLGDFANTNFSSNVEDLKRAAAWLAENEGAPSLLVGHSLGGTACLVAAGALDSVRAVATIGAPADAEHVKHNFGDRVELIEQDGEAEVSLGGRPFRIRRQFLEDIRSQNVEAAVGALKRALLVCHAPLDQQVGIDNATRIFAAAKHPKSFVSLDDADHLLTREDHAAYAAEVISAWAAPYGLDADDALDATAAADAEEGPERVHAEETGEGRFQTRITAGQHVFLADEPERVGGMDSGPDPYELLVAGLGACTSMTLRMYAERKGWPLKKVKVSLHHAKDYTDDCEGCVQGEPRKLDVITRELSIDGDLDDAQREKLLEIADKCPVHRTLHSPVVVRTRFADPDAGRDD